MRPMVALLIPALLVMLGGCKMGPERPSSGSPNVAKPAPALRIVAYINVSSGCQQGTVDLLQSFVDQNPGKVELELNDFGDGDVGARKWQESGYTCMTIELNGSPFVRFPGPTGPKTVTFQMPADLLWTHEELEAAVKAALAGKLKPISEEEANAAAPPMKVTAAITTRQVTKDGMTADQLRIDGKEVLGLVTTDGSKTATDRVKAAAEALKAWTSKPVKPSGLTQKQVTAGWAVMAGDRAVIIATQADADLVGASTEELAKAWTTAIRHALVMSAGPAPAG